MPPTVEWMARARSSAWALVIAVALTSVAWSIRDATRRAVPSESEAVRIVEHNWRMRPTRCGQPQLYDMGGEGHWDYECRFDDGSSLLIRFDGRRIAETETIV
jgi:hypothetical protein